MPFTFVSSFKSNFSHHLALLCRTDCHDHGATKVEKDSGVWVDGDYVGFLKELHGNKKVLLLPGEHEISVRQSGYDDRRYRNVETER
jgi:hypothetical protein